MAKDPYQYFRIEAREILETLGRGLLAIEKGPPPPGLVPNLLRMAHTLKGAARVVRLPEIAEMAHAVEDALSPWRDGARQAGPGEVDPALKLVDAIGERVGRLSQPETSGGAGSAMTGARPVVERMDSGAATARRDSAEAPVQTVRTEVADMDLLLDGLSAAGAQIGSMRRGHEGAGRARRLADLLAEHLASPRAVVPSGSGTAGVSRKTRALAEELRGVLAAAERELEGAVERVEREMRQVRDTAEHLRLLPASALFASLERTARDAAQAVGTRVEFEARGGEVRLDAHVLAGVQGALIQMVRNAVAHGIEPEADRVAAGKPPAGRVLLEVMRRGRRAVFQCRDDGRGLDLDSVRRVARDRGLLAADGPVPSMDQIVQLLLKGGVSTSGVVTEVSGRGIGLDVVREAAARLGGDVDLRSESGRGVIVD